MDYCVNCGERMADGARFCARCGAPSGSEETLVASEETRVSHTGEETRMSHSGARETLPQRVRPLSELQPERRPATNEDIERVIFTVRPTLLFVKLGYAAAALGGLLLVALLTWGLQVSPLISLPVALALLLVPAYRHLKRNMVRYTLTDSKIEIDEGFISHTTRNIPLRNIQDVTVRASVFQRLLRFGNLVVDNAGGEGGATVLRNIPDPRRHADMLLRQLRRWH